VAEALARRAAGEALTDIGRSAAASSDEHLKNLANFCDMDVAGL
jgi:hypothetical protein